MNAKEFKGKTGRAPVLDDLDRVNCPDAGKVGHWQCGFCSEHRKPRFECGCVHREPPVP